MADTVLTINNINKSYGDNLILNGLSLDVHKGEVIVIIGPSGCGKSTLLRCINALEPIQGGEIRLDGELIDGNSRNIAQIRQKIGMVFQNYELFPHLTVLENILLAPVKAQKRSRQEVREEALALLDRVGLKEKAGSYPRQLSGGQKQRVAIVRALCMHPEILLFDEVTAALDPEMVPGVDQSRIFRIYASALTSLKLDENCCISTTDNRLLRRMVRDNRVRGITPEDTIMRWPSVRRGEGKYIFPFQETADAQFNTALLYELPLLRYYAEPLLRRILPSSAAYPEACRLLKFLDYIVPLQPAEISAIPPTSILREFIGGQTL